MIAEVSYAEMYLFVQILHDPLQLVTYQFHQRMPIILRRNEEDEWLSKVDPVPLITDS